ncbi:flagellar basal body protein FliL [Micromonospora yasonensis]|uniref:LppU/SCO3897 family protein n=1 Tax=Micromonospora yasonensis TaxID=1128667 RepID=UPI002232742A|nr:flagellar basal body protein FliL [Micromonospora yasonensis]MCW3840283.1 flagellar basal body protein FliL [Micromonospora yasonensis]
MSNPGPPGAAPDPWDGPSGEAHPPAAAGRAPGYTGQPGTWGQPNTDQRYEPPAQRYGQPAGWATGEPAHPADPGPGDPPYPEPPRPRRGRGPLVAALAVVLLLLLGGLAFWVSRREASGPVSAPGGPTTAAADPTAEASEPAGPATTAGPASTTDPRFVKAGQCVRNDGGTARPKLVITECDPKTYEVLSRIDGPTTGEQDAEAKCAKVVGYTDWFFYNSDLDTLDFVLCLKRR